MIRQVLPRLAIAVIPLVTGAALLAHILLGGSLGMLLVIAASGTGLMGFLAWRRLAPPIRHELKRRAKAGAVAGLLGTAAYDGVRWLLLQVFHFHFQPFDIFSIFGVLLVGAAAPHAVIVAAGVLFHWANGTGFAIGYSMLFGRRGWWAGLAWALGLELIMLAVYPGWLNVKSIGELTSVSMTGHVAYGLVLGTVSQRWLKRR